MKILFVCTGNTCRSPMAEVLAGKLVIDRALDSIIVSSAGTSTYEGAPASDAAVLVAIERGLDLSQHRARQLSRDIIGENDLILVMGPHHLDSAEALGGTGKSFLLTHFASGGTANDAVADPFGGDLGAYRATADELAAQIWKVFDRIAAENLR